MICSKAHLNFPDSATCEDSLDLNTNLSGTLNCLFACSYDVTCMHVTYLLSAEAPINTHICLPTYRVDELDLSHTCSHRAKDKF